MCLFIPRLEDDKLFTEDSTLTLNDCVAAHYNIPTDYEFEVVYDSDSATIHSYSSASEEQLKQCDDVFTTKGLLVRMGNLRRNMTQTALIDVENMSDKINS